MKCVMCPNQKDLKAKKVRHLYRESGLDNVTLDGVLHFRCDACGEDYFNFGDTTKLNAAIAAELIQKKGGLTPKEIRFLRTHLGLSGAEFGRRVNRNQATIYRYESGAEPLPGEIDQLLRHMVAVQMPDRAYDLHDQLGGKSRGKAFKRIILRSAPKGWMVQQAQA